VSGKGRSILPPDGGKARGRTHGSSPGGVNRCFDYAGLGYFGIANDAGFVDNCAGDTKVARDVPGWNICPRLPMLGCFPALLRRVVLVGEKALGGRHRLEL
jgi:hypothetical protein